MSLDIKTTDYKARRHTYSNVAERQGGDRPASRYDEATFDLEPKEHFHYRPVWDPAFELYDASRTAIKMEDWYVLTDPRQFYYATYTISRNKMFDAGEAQLNFVETHNLLASLDPPDRDLVKKMLLPLRHYEWGANMNNMQVTRFGCGTTVTQAASFDAMDRLGLAQLLCRIGLAMDMSADDAAGEDAAKEKEGERGSCLHVTRAEWTTEEFWQPLRQAVENSFVVEDWFELFVAQNFVMDTLVYEFAYRHFDQALLDKGVQCVSLMTEVFRTWFADHDRWVAAVIKRAAEESGHNREQIRKWAEDWSGQGVPAIEAMADFALPETSSEIVTACVEALEEKKTGIGI